jgi:hypothetical protein
MILAQLPVVEALRPLHPDVSERAVLGPPFFHASF